MKVIRARTSQANRDIYDFLRGLGFAAELKGSHGGDGMNSMGARVDGVRVSDELAAAWDRVAGKPTSEIAEALKAVHAAGVR